MSYNSKNNSLHSKNNVINHLYAFQFGMPSFNPSLFAKSLQDSFESLQDSRKKIIEQLYENVSVVVVDEVVLQFEISLKNEYSLEIYHHDLNDFKIDNNIIFLDSTACTCLFYEAMRLPCSHIFFARNSQGLPVFMKNMLPEYARRRLADCDSLSSLISLIFV